MCEKRRGDVNTPAFGLDFDNTANDQVANFGCVACTKGLDGEKLIGFLECPSYCGEN